MLIVINGYIGAGKDTVADILVNDHGFKKFSFAESLKDAIAPIFGWDRVLLDGSTPESRVWRTQVDTWWANRLDIPEFTPRYALQHIGTDVLRKHFCDELWIASLEAKLKKHQGNAVVTDGRFKNEICALTNQDGVVWRVVRNNPEWHSTAVAAASGNKSAITQMAELGVHISEWDWLSVQPDAIISNTTTIDDLKSSVKLLIQ